MSKWGEGVPKVYTERKRSIGKRLASAREITQASGEVVTVIDLDYEREPAREITFLELMEEAPAQAFILKIKIELSSALRSEFKRLLKKIAKAELRLFYVDLTAAPRESILGLLRSFEHAYQGTVQVSFLLPELLSKRVKENAKIRILKPSDLSGLSTLSGPSALSERRNMDPKDHSVGNGLVSVGATGSAVELSVAESLLKLFETPVSVPEAVAPIPPPVAFMYPPAAHFPSPVAHMYPASIAPPPSYFDGARGLVPIARENFFSPQLRLDSYGRPPQFNLVGKREVVPAVAVSEVYYRGYGPQRLFHGAGFFNLAPPVGVPYGFFPPHRADEGGPDVGWGRSSFPSS